nr:hypothetical protein [Tanacetum cinerariifolium]
MANKEENHALVVDEEASTEFALMAKSSLSSENKVYDDSFCSKSCRKNTKNLNTKITKLNEELSDSKTNLYNYKLGLSQVEARLVEFKTQEIKFCEKIRDIERDVKVRNNKIENLMNELKQDIMLYPPPAQVYSPPKKDMSWTGLPEFADDTVTDYSRPTPSIDSSKSNTGDLQNSISSIFEHGESSDSIMSKPMIKFVKAADSLGVIKTNKTKTARKPPVKYAEMYRNTSKNPKVRVNQHFKLKDDTNVLLRTPRQHNMYSIDLNNTVPHKNLTCLVAKASADESLPSKCFENDHTCVACLKRKQHKTFFLRIKDETSGILRNFITKIENLKDLKVKIIRCDNGGEFKNKEMNKFCTKKGIKREFSNARTPQQNGVAERRKRTLIEAARIMLADAKLPVTFWAEAVNTASHMESSNSDAQDACTADVSKSSGISNPTATSKLPAAEQIESLTVESEFPTVSSPVPTVFLDTSPGTISGSRLISKEKEPKKIVDALKDPIYQMDVKSAFLYGTINEEVYVMQPPGFQDPKFPDRVYKVENAMYGLYQTPRAWHQVTPKECHLHAVKRIFIYLKGHPKLGLWYPKESPFDLVAYSDSDYGGATQDRK